MPRAIFSLLFVWGVLWAAGLWFSNATRNDLKEVCYQGFKAFCSAVIAVCIVSLIVILF